MKNDPYAEVTHVNWRVTYEVVFVPPGCTYEMDNGMVLEGPAFVTTPPRWTPEPSHDA